MPDSGMRAKHAGWRVHRWKYPVVWWARRKPRSNLRQRLWDLVDELDWYLVVLPRIKRMNRGR